MKSLRYIMLVVGAAAATACDTEGPVTVATNGPLASIRFVNAVNDSGPQDWRFVDQIENSPTTFALAFRGVFPGAGYVSLGAGARHLKIFQSWNSGDATTATPEIVSKVFFDTTFTFDAGSNYTIVAAGSLRASGSPKAKLYIIKDVTPDPGTSIAIRTLNLTSDPVDMYTAGPTGASPVQTSVGFANPSTYATMSTAASLTVSYTPSGAKTVLASAAAPAGLPGDKVANLTPVGGTTQGGSALTAIVFAATPAASAGQATFFQPSQAAAFKAAAVTYVIDRQPPRGF
jgi:hypothetical protein